MATTAADTGAVRQDIESTRADLAATLYVLGDRIAPKKVVARAKENVRLTLAHKVEDLKARISPARRVRRAVASLRRGDGRPSGAGRGTRMIGRPARPMGELPRAGG